MNKATALILSLLVIECYSSPMERRRRASDPNEYRPTIDHTDAPITEVPPASEDLQNEPPTVQVHSVPEDPHKEPTTARVQSVSEDPPRESPIIQDQPVSEKPQLQNVPKIESRHRVSGPTEKNEPPMKDAPATKSSSAGAQNVNSDDELAGAPDIPSSPFGGLFGQGGPGGAGGLFGGNNDIFGMLRNMWSAATNLSTIMQRMQTMFRTVSLFMGPLGGSQPPIPS